MVGRAGCGDIGHLVPAGEGTGARRSPACAVPGSDPCRAAAAPVRRAGCRTSGGRTAAGVRGARAGSGRGGNPGAAQAADPRHRGTHRRRRPGGLGVRRERRAHDAARPVGPRQRGAHEERRPAPAGILPRARPGGPRRGWRALMAPPRAAAGVPLSDLGSYQQAVRLVLTHDIITGARPRPGVLDQVLRWADQMTRDFREVLGYTLIATTRQVRLSRRLDALDPTQGTMFAKNGRPFDRRRLAYLCLVLASFQRSRVEISLADLVRAFAPAANAIDGLGFDPTVSAHKAAVVDVLDWLADRGALRLSDGSLESWAADAERGDALYDIDHDICVALFRPARPVQHLTSAAGLLDSTFVSAKRSAQRQAAAQRAARALLEYPVVYFAQIEPEIADALRQPGVAENLTRLTGLAAERRAEGIMLADAGGRFTDRPFPGRGGAVNRAAGLLLA